MKLKRIIGWIVLAIPVALCAMFLIAWVRSTNSCDDPAAAPRGSTMKAVVYCDYGPPDVLRIEAAEIPVPTDSQVLVRVRAASVNPLEWHYMRGEPFFA